MSAFTFGGVQGKQIICHNGQSIGIAGAALEAHLNHGDSFAACLDDPESVEEGDFVEVNDVITDYSEYSDYVVDEE